jgi:hypothetical protein
MISFSNLKFTPYKWFSDQPNSFPKRISDFFLGKNFGKWIFELETPPSMIV